MTNHVNADAPALGFDFSIDEPPQKLWQALTDPVIVEKWLAPVVRNGDGAGLSCEKLGATEGRNVTYLWRDPDCGDSIVTFSLNEREDGLSRLSILHEAPGGQAPVALAGNLCCRLSFGTAAARKAANQDRHPPLLLAA